MSVVELGDGSSFEEPDRDFGRHKHIRVILIILLALMVGVGACSPPPSTGVPAIGQRTKTSGCRIIGALPDSACTPGAIISTATIDQICVSGYSKTVRNVTSAEKTAVFEEYGITSHPTGAFEVDHLISLELGGSNDIANLWPEPANPTPGFHQKDQAENEIHARVCASKINLAEAQREIASDWLVLFNGGLAAPPDLPGDSAVDTEVATPSPETTAGSVAATDAPENGATAKCADGTFNFNATHAGACSNHGGVIVWYK